MDGVDVNNLLTDDLLKEIFVRLPCKSAIRSKLVCKLWHSIISNPCFGSSLIGHQGEQGCHGRIFSSCNGLLLCSTHGSVEAMYYVCNPFTKHWAAIPPPPLPDSNGYSTTPVGFVCDPYYQVDHHGGVMINPHCRFRILRAFGDSFSDEPELDVDVFSSETGDWAKVKIVRQKSYMRFPITSPKRVVSYKGRIYLQVGRNIVVFDPFENEVLCEIDLPEDRVLRPRSFEGFSCCYGSLWMCQLNNHEIYPKLFIWKLKEDNERVQYWSLEREVSFSDPMRRTRLASDCMRTGRVLAIHPDNSDIIYMSIASRGIIVAWNLGAGTTEVVFQSEPSFKLGMRWVDTFFLDVPVWPSPVPKILNH